MQRLAELGATPHERAETAESFAREHKIDLASAYSVLLGLMDLSAACSLKQAATASSDTIAEVPNAGDRSIRASALALQHDLPLHLAFDVANGKLLLADALQQAHKGPAQTRTALTSSPSTSSSSLLARFALVGIGLAVGGLIVVSIRYASDGTPPMLLRAAVENTAAQVVSSPRPERGLGGLPQIVDPPSFETVETRDEQGRITRIAGKTPRSVLEAFCAAGGLDDPREPHEIVPSEPPRAGVKVGLLHRKFEPGLRFALWLRRDSTSGEWIAGNGTKPLEARPY